MQRIEIITNGMMCAITLYLRYIDTFLSNTLVATSRIISTATIDKLINKNHLLPMVMLPDIPMNDDFFAARSNKSKSH